MATMEASQGRGPAAAFIALNVAGGIAVLGSYVLGLGRPDAGAVWGGVPDALRPVYTVSMFLAAFGYFPMTAYALLRLAKPEVRIGSRGFGVVNLCYALILGPSALWMPLTFAMLDAPSTATWLAVRGVLFLAAAGSLGVLAALFAAEPRDRGGFWKLAVAGAVLFCNQTVLLDALIWPAYFPTSS